MWALAACPMIPASALVSTPASVVHAQPRRGPSAGRGLDVVGLPHARLWLAQPSAWRDAVLEWSPASFIGLLDDRVPEAAPQVGGGDAGLHDSGTGPGGGTEPSIEKRGMVERLSTVSRVRGLRPSPPSLERTIPPWPSLPSKPSQHLWRRCSGAADRDRVPRRQPVQLGRHLLLCSPHAGLCLLSSRRARSSR